jgi:HAD superfamily hydrolase (TIGR01549 family)
MVGKLIYPSLLCTPMEKQKITTLLFDFGNVLLPLDVDATYKAFKELGAKPSLHKELSLFHKWERGEILEKEFIAEIREYINYAAHESSIWHAWNAMILDFPQAHLEMLKKLKKEYKLVLVSNINHEHEQFIKQKMGLFTYLNFIKQFNGVYYSHHIGLRKPETDYFKTVLLAEDITGEEAFFIDDTIANITEAKNLGIHTWHFNPQEDNLLDLPKKLKAL